MPHGQMLVVAMNLGHELALNGLAKGVLPARLRPANVLPPERAKGLGLSGKRINGGIFHLEHGRVAAVRHDGRNHGVARVGRSAATYIAMAIGSDYMYVSVSAQRKSKSQGSTGKERTAYRPRDNLGLDQKLQLGLHQVVFLVAPPVVEDGVDEAVDARPRGQQGGLVVYRGAAGVEHVEEAGELDFGELVGARDGSSHAGVRVGAAEGVEEALAGLPRLLGRDDGNGREVDGRFGSPVALDGARLRGLRRPGRAACSGGGVRGHGMRAAELHRRLGALCPAGDGKESTGSSCVTRN